MVIAQYVYPYWGCYLWPLFIWVVLELAVVEMQTEKIYGNDGFSDNTSHVLSEYIEPLIFKRK